MRNIFKIIGIGLLAVIAFACDEEEDCSMTARPMMQCRLYGIVAETGDTLQVALSQLSVLAEGADTVLINRQQQVKDLMLPLRYTEEKTVLIFRYYDETGEEPLVVEDTLTVHHTNTPYFISIDCGYQMKQVITSVSHTSHVLDGVELTNPEAGIYGEENIKLFYR